MYGMILGIPEQRELIEKHCFGDCGKIIVGGLIDDHVGEICVCMQDDCKHLAGQMSVQAGTIEGEPVYFRKLKENP